MSERASPRVVIDACVLASHRICDLILRLAEEPGLYEPKWSDEIIGETVRTLEHKLNWPVSLVGYFESQLRASFSQAWVYNQKNWTPLMTNDPKDRHVTATAVACDASLIVTFNLRHFRLTDLEKWNVVAVHPQRFLMDLFHRDPDAVRLKVQEQATEGCRSLANHLNALRSMIPEFVALIES